MFDTNRDNENEGQLIIPYGTRDGRMLWADFASIPSMLIAGTTGSGKTIFVQTLLLELMKKYTPQDLRIIIYDSKVIDYNLFAGSAYCILPVIHDPSKCVTMLYWLTNEIQHRLDDIANISRKPHIFAIIDDCSVIMDHGESYDCLLRILQKARQVKIHCWLVTYNPSTDIIPVNLRMIIHSRVAFHLTTRSMSRAVLDANGAETLRVPGEMIFKHIAELNRCEAIHVPEQELAERLEEAYSRLTSCAPEPVNVDLQKENHSHDMSYDIDENGRDEYFAQVGRFIIDKDKASIGVIQRVYKLGFNRAAHIMDQLSEAGVVGPEEGTKPRKILMTMDQFETFLKSGNPLEEPHKEVNLALPKEASQEQGELPKKAEPQQKPDVSRVPHIWLTPQGSIKGINATIEAKREGIVVRDNESNQAIFLATGLMIERIQCKEPGVFTLGSITIVDKKGESVTITFKWSAAKEFFRFLRQLANDIKKRIELV